MDEATLGGKKVPSPPTHTPPGQSDKDNSDKTDGSATLPSRSGAKNQPKARQKERWQNLQSHLDEALNQWNEISDQMKDELSPDEKRLQEVKQLLNQLKVKLEDF